MATDIKLKGKVALITGAASGIGAATAQKFAELGATLSLNDISADNLKAVGETCQAIAQKCGNPKPHLLIGDITMEEVRQKYVEDTLKQFGRIDILINNAGMFIQTSILTTPMSEVDKVFNLLLRAPYDLCRLCAQHLISTKGCIVNVASINTYVLVSKNPAYSTAKAALRHFTRCLADELGPYDVRAVSISPGITKTNLFKTFHEYGSLPTEQLEQRVDQLAEKAAGLERAAHPSEIAKAIAFLVSDDASYVTGTDLLVDGGIFSRHLLD